MRTACFCSSGNGFCDSRPLSPFTFRLARIANKRAGIRFPPACWRFSLGCRAGRESLTLRHENVARIGSFPPSRTKKNKPTAMTSLEDGTFHKDPNDEPEAPAENIIDISPNYTSSDNGSDDEELDIPRVVSDPPNEVTEVPNAFDIREEVQKSVAEFDKSITEHQSYFWDQEGLGPVGSKSTSSIKHYCGF